MVDKKHSVLAGVDYDYTEANYSPKKILTQERVWRFNDS